MNCYKIVCVFLIVKTLVSCSSRRFGLSSSEALQSETSEAPLLDSLLPKSFDREKSKNVTLYKSPIRSLSNLDQPKFEPVNKLTQAQVVLVDYDLLAEDFPNLKRKPSQTESVWKKEVDSWLLNNTAWISQNQIKLGEQKKVNTQIPAEPSSPYSLQAFRPKFYGRALVLKLPAKEAALIGPGIGLVDVKGAGALDPKMKDHENGLCTLAEAIREFALEKLTLHTFIQADKVRLKNLNKNLKIEHHTNRIYAVLAAGFNVVNPSLKDLSDPNSISPESVKQEPAALIIRRAHSRLNIDPDDPFEPMDTAYQVIFDMERSLRQFGITSAGDTLPSAVRELVNLQLTSHYEVLDFGAFLVPDKFEKGLLFDELNVEIMSDSNRAKPFLVPDENLKVPQEDWGTALSGVNNPQYDNLWIRSRELGQPYTALAQTEAVDQVQLNNQRTKINNYLTQLFQKLLAKWDLSHPP